MSIKFGTPLDTQTADLKHARDLAMEKAEEAYADQMNIFIEGKKVWYGHSLWWAILAYESSLIDAGFVLVPLTAVHEEYAMRHAALLAVEKES